MHGDCMRISPVQQSPSVSTGDAGSPVLGARRPIRFSGFTLVELVIALALIALISLVLFSGLRLGNRVWEGVESLAERNAAPRIAHNFMARALAQARPSNVTFEGEQVPVFRGDAQNLEFVAPLSEHVGTPGLYILRLSLEHGDVDRLVLTRWLLHPDVLDGVGDIPPWEPFDGATHPADAEPLDADRASGAYGRTLLLDNVSELEISYFGITQKEPESDWYSEWLDEPRMPLAVRIHLATKEQPWPDMVIRLPES